MVEEIKDASDFKKLIGKNKGEEDPLLVAQRFLNIFRQLHIFDQKRREEFNSMILALPPEIRGSFGLLPGGSVLQEYVDELEVSKGLIKSNGSSSISPNLFAPAPEKESPLAKIKNAQQQTSTPAQVNISGDAKLVADASFAQVLSQSVSSALMAANASKTDDFDKLVEAIKENATNAKFVPDDKFAATMARAFSQALQFSDANKKADIKELIAAVKESHKIEFPEGFSIGGGNSVASPLIADETAFAQTIAMAVAKAVSSNNSAPNLSEEIKDLAAAVRESRKIEFPEGFSLGGGTSTGTATPLITDEAAFARTIAEAMAKVVNVSTTAASTPLEIRELVEAIRDNNNTNAEKISQAMVSGLTPLLNSLQTEKTGNQQTPTSINVTADNNFSEIITKAVAQTFEISEKRHQEQTERLIAGFQDIISKERNSNDKESRNNKNKHNNQLNVGMLGSEQLEKITQDFTQTLQNINNSRQAENREISQAIKETSKELVRMFAKQSSTVAQPQDKEMINDIITKVAQAQSSIFQEMAKQQTNELSTIISLALKESQKSSIDTIVDAVKKLQGSRSIFNFASSEVWNQNQTDIDDIIDEVSTTELTEESNKKSIKATIKEKKSSVAKYIKSAFERTPIEEQSPASGADWGFVETEEKTSDDVIEQDDEIVENSEENFSSEEDNNDWQWEYEDSETAEPQGVEGEDWEWEYEDSDSISGEEGEDWEWEYEESDATETQGLEGEDWEWEYEEESDTDEVSTTSLDEKSGIVTSEAINEQTTNADLSEGDSNEENLSLEEMAIAEEIPPLPQGEIVIAELRNKQNTADPYLSDNIGV